MNCDPEVKEMINRIAFNNFMLGMMFYKHQKKMNCPECGSCLVLGETEIYETLSEHVSCLDSPPRIVFECKNKLCKTYKKGYWGDIFDGSFYNYREGDEKLIGDSLGFNDRIHSLVFGKFDHEKYEYSRKGKYIGPNWLSKTMRIIFSTRCFISRWWYIRSKKVEAMQKV